MCSRCQKNPLFAIRINLFSNCSLAVLQSGVQTNLWLNSQINSWYRKNLWGNLKADRPFKFQQLYPLSYLFVINWEYCFNRNALKSIGCLNGMNHAQGNLAEIQILDRWILHFLRSLCYLNFHFLFLNWFPSNFNDFEFQCLSDFDFVIGQNLLCPFHYFILVLLTNFWNVIFRSLCFLMIDYYCHFKFKTTKHLH